VSFDDGIPISMNDFEEFKSGYAAHGKQYMLGKISLRKLDHWSRIDGVGIILAPHALFDASQESRKKLSRSVA
jgi:homoserine dehydrogenase